MTAIKDTLPSAATRRAAPPRRLPIGLAHALRRPERRTFALPAGVAIVGLVVGILTVFRNDTDGLIGPLLAGLGAASGAAVAVLRQRSGVLDRPGVVLSAVTLVAAIIVFVLPPWLWGGNVNGIVHRTVISDPLLIVLSTVGAAYAIRRLLADSPSGQDMALVPVFTTLIVLGLAPFGLVLGLVLSRGIGSFRFDLLTTAWHRSSGASGFTYDIGFLNNILGTLLLIFLTLTFAILPGVGAGVFITEYPGRAARIINFCTTMLRAIAMFIIGVAALGLVRGSSGFFAADSFLAALIRGSFTEGGTVQVERGSFVLAGLCLAMLVMPIIARLTAEGLKSVPREMREGSVALGATDGYGLRRVLLPWAAPNIVTALILAGAEAGGGLAILMFLSGVGQYGVGLLSGVTSLDYAVFAAKYGPRFYYETMRTYQFTAALILLVMTLGLTLLALTLQRRFAKRYRGSLTAD